MRECGHLPETSLCKMVSLLGAVVLGASKTMIVSMLSEKIVLKLTLEILEWLAKRTTNQVDDRLVEMMRERLAETGVV